MDFRAMGLGETRLEKENNPTENRSLLVKWL